MRCYPRNPTAKAASRTSPRIAGKTGFAVVPVGRQEKSGYPRQPGQDSGPGEAECARNVAASMSTTIERGIGFHIVAGFFVWIVDTQ